MNKELLIKALDIAISVFDYEQDFFKADDLRDYRDKLVKERESKMSACNWCGDAMKEGVYEIHKCLEEKEGEE